jgi:hypothetical protein
VYIALAIIWLIGILSSLQTLTFPAPPDDDFIAWHDPASDRIYFWGPIAGRLSVSYPINALTTAQSMFVDQGYITTVFFIAMLLIGAPMIIGIIVFARIRVTFNRVI